MTTDTTALGATATMVPVPVIASDIASDTEAITTVPDVATWITVDPAIAQVPLGHFLLVEMLTALGSPARRHRLPGEALAGEQPVAWGCRHVGNYLRDGVLLPDYGQI
jgi:hypothetical protein